MFGPAQKNLLLQKLAKKKRKANLEESAEFPRTPRIF
jgi:hypothetical protein